MEFSGNKSKNATNLIKLYVEKINKDYFINNVKDHPFMAGNPNNIEFLNKSEHLDAHGGNYRNKIEGTLLNRSIE